MAIKASIIFLIVTFLIGCAPTPDQSFVPWLPAPKLSGKFVASKVLQQSVPPALIDSSVVSIPDTANAEKVPAQSYSVHTRAEFEVETSGDSAEAFLGSADGKLIVNLWNILLAPGSYLVDFSDSVLQPGVYVFVVKFSDGRAIRRWVMF